jgi:hypothetical protein
VSVKRGVQKEAEMSLFGCLMLLSALLSIVSPSIDCIALLLQIPLHPAVFVYPRRHSQHCPHR